MQYTNTERTLEAARLKFSEFIESEFEDIAENADKTQLRRALNNFMSDMYSNVAFWHKGHDIMTGDYLLCSHCHTICSTSSGLDLRRCPKCGDYMIGVE